MISSGAATAKSCGPSIGCHLQNDVARRWTRARGKGAVLVSRDAVVGSLVSHIFQRALAAALEHRTATGLEVVHTDVR